MTLRNQKDEILGRYPREEVLIVYILVEPRDLNRGLNKREKGLNKY